MGRYRIQHRQVELLRGRPRFCEACGLDGHEPPYYYEGGSEFEWANLTGRYDDPQDYIRLCVSCHRRHDARKRHDDEQDHRFEAIRNGKYFLCGECRRRYDRRNWPEKRRRREVSRA